VYRFIEIVKLSFEVAPGLRREHEGSLLLALPGPERKSSTAILRCLAFATVCGSQRLWQLCPGLLTVAIVQSLIRCVGKNTARIAIIMRIIPKINPPAALAFRRKKRVPREAKVH